MEWEKEFGSPDPLGVTWIESDQAYNFALYSKHATEVTLFCYYKDDPTAPIFSFYFDKYQNKTGRIWHTRIPESKLKGRLLWLSSKWSIFWFWL
jgi:glycogen operon protein